MTHALTVDPLVSRSSRGKPTPLSPGHNTDSHVAVTAGQVRRLTPSECESLQGFPRGWTLLEPDTDWRDYPQPDGRRYAACGDAVTVNVAYWLGRRLLRVVERLAPVETEVQLTPEEISWDGASKHFGTIGRHRVGSERAA